MPGRGEKGLHTVKSKLDFLSLSFYQLSYGTQGFRQDSNLRHTDDEPNFWAYAKFQRLN